LSITASTPISHQEAQPRLFNTAVAAQTAAMHEKAAETAKRY
jgi:hypothetical protein